MSNANGSCTGPCTGDCSLGGCHLCSHGETVGDPSTWYQPSETLRSIEKRQTFCEEDGFLLLRRLVVGVDGRQFETSDPVPGRLDPGRSPADGLHKDVSAITKVSMPEPRLPVVAVRLLPVTHHGSQECGIPVSSKLSCSLHGEATEPRRHLGGCTHGIGRLDPLRNMDLVNSLNSPVLRFGGALRAGFAAQHKELPTLSLLLQDPQDPINLLNLGIRSGHHIGLENAWWQGSDGQWHHFLLSAVHRDAGKFRVGPLDSTSPHGGQKGWSATWQTTKTGKRSPRILR